MKIKNEITDALAEIASVLKITLTEKTTERLYDIIRHTVCVALSERSACKNDGYVFTPGK